jgi:ABC transport system ATP-binding/permease protein
LVSFGSHGQRIDRALIDNLVTSTLILSGNGQVTESIGGYADWRQSQSQVESVHQPVTQSKKKTTHQQKPQATEPHKLSYHEQRELDQLPEKIEALEAEQSTLNERMVDPAFYRGDHTDVSQAVERLKTLEAELAQAYRRWVELDG